MIESGFVLIFSFLCCFFIKILKRLPSVILVCIKSFFMMILLFFIFNNLLKFLLSKRTGRKIAITMGIIAYLFIMYNLLKFLPKIFMIFFIIFLIIAGYIGYPYLLS